MIIIPIVDNWSVQTSEATISRVYNNCQYRQVIPQPGQIRRQFQPGSTGQLRLSCLLDCFCLLLLCFPVSVREGFAWLHGGRRQSRGSDALREWQSSGIFRMGLACAKKDNRLELWPSQDGESAMTCHRQPVHPRKIRVTGSLFRPTDNQAI